MNTVNWTHTIDSQIALAEMMELTPDETYEIVANSVSEFWNNEIDQDYLAGTVEY